METLTIKRDGEKYGFKRGDKYVVKRGVNGELIVVVGENTPNAILSERRARYYGDLSGTPQPCFC